MTIGMAYIRKLNSGSEIVVASDSRLSGGESWDACQKVFPLQRGDCALVFAGAAYRFFPIFNQIVTFCNLHKRIYSRAMPLRQLSGKVQKLSEELLAGIKDHSDKFPDGAFQFVLCGWDWLTGEPVFYKFVYDEQTGNARRLRHQLDARRMHLVHPVLLIGDCVPEIKTFYNQAARATDVRLDFQPLQIIQEIIDKNEIRTIGGAVQGVKLYPHLNALPLAIHRGNDRFVFGRKLYPWERVDYEVADVHIDTTLHSEGKAASVEFIETQLSDADDIEPH